jgi:hypothetical protein
MLFHLLIILSFGTRVAKFLLPSIQGLGAAPLFLGLHVVKMSTMGQLVAYFTTSCHAHDYVCKVWPLQAWSLITKRLPLYPFLPLWLEKVVLLARGSALSTIERPPLGPFYKYLLQAWRVTTTPDFAFVSHTSRTFNHDPLSI